MIDKSFNSSNVIWDARLSKTVSVRWMEQEWLVAEDVLKQGVKRTRVKLATNFCISASNMPILANTYPGKLIHAIPNTASKTKSIRWLNSRCDELPAGTDVVLNMFVVERTDKEREIS